MSEKYTASSGPDRDDPPRFTREMAVRGRHMAGDRVIREARPRGGPPKQPGRPCGNPRPVSLDVRAAADCRSGWVRETWIEILTG